MTAMKWESSLERQFNAKTQNTFFTISCTHPFTQTGVQALGGEKLWFLKVWQLILISNENKSKEKKNT